MSDWVRDDGTFKSMDEVFIQEWNKPSGIHWDGVKGIGIGLMIVGVVMAFGGIL